MGRREAHQPPARPLDKWGHLSGLEMGSQMHPWGHVMIRLRDAGQARVQREPGVGGQSGFLGGFGEWSVDWRSHSRVSSEVAYAAWTDDRKDL